MFAVITSCARKYNLELLGSVRWASKKTSGSTRNQKGHARPKHRGWKLQDGAFVHEKNILATQYRVTRFHPGLNVGFGRNGTLYALEHGRVMVTCEKVDFNWNHPWIEQNYPGRAGQTVYKKYFNVVPEPQEGRFKLIDMI